MERETGETPDALLNKPELTVFTEEYYRAFELLNNSRAVTMGGVGPIPLSEMKAYFEAFGISSYEEREQFVMMMIALDSVFMEHVDTKAQKAASNKTPKTVGRVPRTRPRRVGGRR